LTVRKIDYYKYVYKNPKNYAKKPGYDNQACAKANNNPL